MMSRVNLKSELSMTF